MLHLKKGERRLEILSQKSPPDSTSWRDSAQLSLNLACFTVKKGLQVSSLPTTMDFLRFCMLESSQNNTIARLAFDEIRGLSCLKFFSEASIAFVLNCETYIIANPPSFSSYKGLYLLSTK